MIPGYFPTDAPPGEQSLYRALAKSRDTDDWIVLHSLGIAGHVEKPEGEADFVVIAPGLGILVIEVKSHTDFDFKDGVWRLGKQDPTARGPIKQGRQAAHSIRQFLEAKHVNMHSLGIVSCAWFTSTRARDRLPGSCEWHDWEILDIEDMKAPVDAIRRTLLAGIRHLKSTVTGFGRAELGPDLQNAERIALLLRPNFEIGVSAGDLRNARNDQLIHFIDEQYTALDAMADNPAVLFTGPAGSGKTFLAMEAARREVSSGHHGRLICFNSLLGKRLASDMPHSPGFYVGTFHSQMLNLTGLTPRDNSEFWATELPERAVEALLELGDAAQGDFLIVDEVQDLLTEPNLLVFDLLVKGGLKHGRVLMFGDFEGQTIYDVGDGRDLLRSRMPNLTMSKLVVNCRNLPRIGYAVNDISGLKPGYQRFRREDNGVNPSWLTYRRGEDQLPKLREAIRMLREVDKFNLNEIVILSPLAGASAAATTTDDWLKLVLRSADGKPARGGTIHYSSIHAFKGLEAPAVIITDLDRQLIPNFGSVLYVGLTRATDRLIGVVEQETGTAIIEGRL